MTAELANVLAMPTSIDLFCGAGGLTLGLARSGFRVVLGSDSWQPALETFAANFPGAPVLAADARELTPADLLAKADLDDPPDLVVGGPPCQGFSSAGARDGNDPRNTLVSVFARLATGVRPRAIVFENVEGFITAKAGRFVIALLDPIIEAGYRVSLEKVNVANFGVPQLRKRVLAIAVLGSTPPALSATHHAWGAPGVHLATINSVLEPTPTVEEALSGLPGPSPIAPGDPLGHFAAPVSKTDLDRMKAMRPGQTMRDLPESLWHASYRRRAYRRVCDGTPTERRGGAPAGLRRLRGDEPSRAITSAAVREFVHPVEDRPLTLREAARLQTFPDEFTFCGSRSDSQTLVGNAVPPVFANSIGIAVRDHLLVSTGGNQGKGGLVRFHPTLAEGMSPALAGVVKMVRERYLGGDEYTLWD
jgi:DNA (cytosine-5)-methyltransferase 1